MKKAIRRAAVLGLSVGLVMASLSGCSKEKETFDTDAAAITVNGDEISAGVFNFAVRYNQVSLESLYQSLGVEDPYNEDMFGTGSTLGEQAKTQIATLLTEALLAEQHMADYGISLTDEEEAQIEAVAARFIEDNEESVLAELSVNQDIVERYLELSVIQTRVEEQMSADVDTEVSDEEAAQRKIQYVLFTPVQEEEAEEETEELSEAVETEVETAEEIAAETEEETAALIANDTVNTQAADETEDITESAEQDVTEAVIEETEEETEAETEDPETVAARERAYEQAMELIEKVKAGEELEEAAEELGKTVSENTFGSDYSVTELVEATDGLADGTLVEEPVLTSTGSYYVVKLVTQLDREATDEEKESIVNERKQECIDELYDEWTEASEVTTDEEVLAKVTFDYHLAQAAAAEIEEETETEIETE